MTLIAESEKYPYISFQLEAADNIKIKKEAYVDTGAEFAGLFIPRNLLKNFNEPTFVHRFTLADGTEKPFDCFLGKIKVGSDEFETVVVLLEKPVTPLMGRNLLDKIIANFDGPNQKLKFLSV